MGTIDIPNVTKNPDAEQVASFPIPHDGLGFSSPIIVGMAKGAMSSDNDWNKSDTLSPRMIRRKGVDRPISVRVIMRTIVADAMEDIPADVT